MNNKKSIIFVLGSLNIGGAEKVLINYVNGFNRYYSNLFHVEVFLISKEGALFQYLDDNLKVNYLYRGNTYINGNLIFIFFYKVYRKILFNLFCYIPKLYSLFYKRYSSFEFGFILVQDLHYFSKTSFGKRKFLWIQNNLSNVDKADSYNDLRIYDKVDVVIANSLGIYNDLIDRIKLPEYKVKMCYNPVDFSKIFDLSNSVLDFNIKTNEICKPYLVTLGRAVYQKGFDILIEAFEILLKSGFDLQLVIIGGGMLENELIQLVKEKKIEDRIIFIGSISNPYPIVANSVLYVCSSRYEGLPTAMIEAMSLGKVVVSTPCDFGPKEILDGGEYGILCSDISSSSLAESLLNYLNLEIEKKNLLIQKSIDRSQFFSVESTLINLTKLLPVK